MANQDSEKLSQFVPPEPHLPAPFERIHITHGGKARPEVHAVRLGSGAEGSVWRCWMLDCPEMPLAIKFFSLSAGQRMLDQIPYELSIRHPSFLKVISFLDLMFAEGAVARGWLPYAKITELADCSLERLLNELAANGKKLNWKLTWRLVRQLLDGLIYLHEEVGYCHRDFHLRNLFVQHPKNKNRRALRLPEIVALADEEKLDVLIGDLGVAASMADENAVGVLVREAMSDSSGTYDFTVSREQDTHAFIEVVCTLLVQTEFPRESSDIQSENPERDYAQSQHVMRWMSMIAGCRGRRRRSEASDEPATTARYSLGLFQKLMPQEKGTDLKEHGLNWQDVAKEWKGAIPETERCDLLTTFIDPMTDNPATVGPAVGEELESAIEQVALTGRPEVLRIAMLNPVVHTCNVRDADLKNLNRGRGKGWVAKAVAANLRKIRDRIGNHESQRSVVVRLYATNYQCFYLRTPESIRLSFYVYGEVTSKTHRYKQSVFTDLSDHMSIYFKEVWEHPLTISLEEYWYADVDIQSCGKQTPCWYVGPSPQLIGRIPPEFLSQWFSDSHKDLVLALRLNKTDDMRLLEDIRNRNCVSCIVRGEEDSPSLLSFHAEEVGGESAIEWLRVKYGDNRVQDENHLVFVRLERKHADS